MDDFYKVLNIPRTAGPDEIIAGFRREMRTWTQRESNASTLEKRQEAERMIKLVGEAQEVLTDPQRRSEYDRRLETFQHQGNGSSSSSSHQADEVVAGLIEKATFLINSGNYPPAIGLLKRAVSLEPGHPVAERMLKEAKREWGQFLIRSH